MKKDIYIDLPTSDETLVEFIEKFEYDPSKTQEILSKYEEGNMKVKKVGPMNGKRSK